VAERTLILGLGNILLGDDGLGVRAVERLQACCDVPPDLSVLDGGTLGLALMQVLSSVDRAILVDAVMTGEPPGTLVRLSGDAVAPAIEAHLSPHQIGVADLLDGLRWLDLVPPELLLVGIVPDKVELGLELSPAVERRMPELVQRVIEEARDLGHAIVEREA
jgi:hydrogenase maturation protease